MTYDSNGNLLSSRDANGVGQDCVYDFRDRQTSCTDTHGDVTATSYDQNNNVIVTTDAKSNTVTCKFDPRNRRFECIDRINAKTETRYDQNSNVSYIKDGQNSLTSYVYDVRNLKTETVYPDHSGTAPGDPDYGIVKHDYDGASRTIRMIDQQGDTRTLTYDMASRLLQRDYRTLANSPDGTISDSDTFEYDDAGRQVKATSGRYDNVCEFTFDEAGRGVTESLTIEATANPTTFTTSLQYDWANRLTKLTYPDGSVVNRKYTVRNQLRQLLWNGAVVHDRTYDDGARLDTATHGNGIVATRNYRNDNLLSSINSTGNVGNYSYDYDANKNKTQEAITGPLSGYGFGTGSGAATVYDDENRLTAWNRSDGNLNHAWDLSLVGNWNSITRNSTIESRTYSVAHEITSIGANNAVTHDAKGNLTADSDGRSMVWDFDNKLKSVTVPAGVADAIQGTHTYTYDALGRRVTKTVDDATANGGAGVTTTTLFVCRGQQVLCEYNVPAGGAPTVNSPDQKFVYASYVDEPILKDGKFSDGTTTGIVYYSRNQQYSVTTLTDSTGNVVERYGYTAYGKVTLFDATGTQIADSAYANPYTYTARRSDPETDLMYFRARYYDPETGEFISRDPMEYVDGMSQYRAYFVPGAVDPLGLAMLNVNGNLPRGWFNRPDKFTVTQGRDGWRHDMQLLWGYTFSLNGRGVESINGRLRFKGAPNTSGSGYGFRNKELIENLLSNPPFTRLWKAEEASAKSAWLGGHGGPEDGKCVECFVSEVDISMEAFSVEIKDELLKAILDLLKAGRDKAAAALAKRYGIPIADAAKFLDVESGDVENTLAVKTKNVLVTCADGKEYVGAFNLPNTAKRTATSRLDIHGGNGNGNIGTDWYQGVTTLINSSPSNSRAGRPLLSNSYEAGSK